MCVTVRGTDRERKGGKDSEGGLWEGSKKKHQESTNQHLNSSLFMDLSEFSIQLVLSTVKSDNQQIAK
jgi:hypothetical protein